MSAVQQSDLVLARSASKFEGLTNRLLALRAEIDAILTELAAAADSAAAATEAASAATVTIEPSSPLQGQADAAKSAGGAGAEAFEASQAIGSSIEDSEAVPGCGDPQGGLADADTLIGKEEEPPLPAEEPGDTACEPVAGAAETSDTALTAAPAEATTDPQPAPLADATCEPSTQQVPTEPGEATAQAAGTMAAAEPVADAPEPAEVPAAPNVVAMAPVALDARRNKRKGEFSAARTRPARTGRRVLGRIAACILLLLTGVVALVMTDRAALGNMAQSLPGWSSLPSAMSFARDWSFLPDWRAAEAAPGEPARSEEPATDILLQYRAAWPTGA